MPPPIRQRIPTSKPGLDWLVTDDGSRTLFDISLNETFHSGCGAVAETLIVYLLNSGIASRLSQQLPTSVLEYGLGTGTALLMTAALADYYQAPLRYVALEKDLLPSSVLAALELPEAIQRCIAGGFAEHSSLDIPFSSHHFDAVGHLHKQFIESISGLSASSGNVNFSDQLANSHSLRLGNFAECILSIGDARHLKSGIPRGDFDAVYFDAFSPETNPELWTEAVFAQAAAMLKQGGTLVSYCVKSRVQQALRNVGFQITKAPGPVGGKREVLLAMLPQSSCMSD